MAAGNVLGSTAPEDAQHCIAGLILLAAVPTMAMVFAWPQLTRGDESNTLLQVSVNDAAMIFALAPIVAFLLGVTDIAVSKGALVLSVILFVALPLAAGIWTRPESGPGAWSARTGRIWGWGPHDPG